MALKALTCPQCGANLQLDDQNEVGYCQYCGAKVQIKEIIEIRHTVDNSQVVKNHRIMATRSYDSKNYHDAEKYYMDVLEEIPNDIVSLYRKAICSVYNTYEKQLSFFEYTTYMNEARKELKDLQDEELKQQYITEIDQALLKLQDEIIGKYSGCEYMYDSYQACCRKELAWVHAIDLCDIIVSSVLEQTALSKALSLAIDFCDVGWKRTLNYRVVTSSQQEMSASKVNYNVGQDTIEKIMQARNKYIDKYNSIPINTVLLHQLQDKKHQLLEELAELEEMLEDPMKKLQYTKEPFSDSKNRWMTSAFFLPTVVFVIITIILLIMKGNVPENGQEYAKIINMISVVIGIGFLTLVIGCVGAAFYWFGLDSRYHNRKRKEYDTFRVEHADELNTYQKNRNASIQKRKEIEEIELEIIKMTTKKK